MSTITYRFLLTTSYTLLPRSVSTWYMHYSVFTQQQYISHMKHVAFITKHSNDTGNWTGTISVLLFKVNPHSTGHYSAIVLWGRAGFLSVLQVSRLSAGIWWRQIARRRNGIHYYVLYKLHCFWKDSGRSKFYEKAIKVKHKR